MWKPKDSGIFSLLVTLVFAGLLLSGQPTMADDAETTPTTSAQDVQEVLEVSEQKALSDAQQKSLVDARASIEANLTDIQSLARRSIGETGVMRQMLETRRDNLVTAALTAALDFAGQAADLRDEGYDVTAYTEQVTLALKELPPAIRDAFERILSRVVIPDFSQSAIEQAAIDEQFFIALNSIIKINAALIETEELRARFSLETDSVDAEVHERIETGAANASVFLDIAIVEANNLRAGLSAMPDDAELIGKLRVAESRVKRTAEILESYVIAMTGLELSTMHYQQQLLMATGAISSSSLDIGVISRLLQEWGNALLDTTTEQGPDFLFKAFFFLLIIYVFVKLAGLVQRAVETALNKNSQHFSQLLRYMVSATSRNVIIIFGVLIALSQIGITLGPLLTGLGIAGFVIGFALQDSLSNFASGMMILFYRPFDVGDTIGTSGVQGKVSSMSLVNTTILTFDNQSLIIPNNKIWQDVITNFTDQKERRIDMEFGIAYDEDIDRVEKLLLEIVNADERVLESPPPVVKVAAFGDSAVTLYCWPWVKPEDYWDVLWDFNKQVKQAFDREGIVIPFPQRDVHLYKKEVEPN